MIGDILARDGILHLMSNPISSTANLVSVEVDEPAPEPEPSEALRVVPGNAPSAEAPDSEVPVAEEGPAAEPYSEVVLTPEPDTEFIEPTDDADEAGSGSMGAALAPDVEPTTESSEEALLDEPTAEALPPAEPTGEPSPPVEEGVVEGGNWFFMAPGTEVETLPLAEPPSAETFFTSGEPPAPEEVAGSEEPFATSVPTPEPELAEGEATFGLSQGSSLEDTGGDAGQGPLPEPQEEEEEDWAAGNASTADLAPASPFLESPTQSTTGSPADSSPQPSPASPIPSAANPPPSPTSPSPSPAASPPLPSSPPPSNASTYSPPPPPGPNPFMASSAPIDTLIDTGTNDSSSTNESSSEATVPATRYYLESIGRTDVILLLRGCRWNGACVTIFSLYSQLTHQKCSSFPPPSKK